ncbi:MAG: ATP-binding protein [Halanaerobium sp.]|nr:ATP-binding protein [Halanaerobium sp.]
MKVAIASGKGGTGKTTVAANLAAANAAADLLVMDCDVEEPNLHLFLKPEIKSKWSSTVVVPEIVRGMCTYCGKCAKICAFNALGVLKDNILVFPELCHSCGACSYLCPEGAIREVPRQIGKIEKGQAGNISFAHGILNPGEALVPPLISDLKHSAPTKRDTILDVPPGTSCPVVESIKDADFVLLVTEPTPFGLHDLSLAVEMCRKLGLPMAIVVNRWGIGNDDVLEYAQKEQIDILLRIPFAEEFARVCARGSLIVEEFPEWQDKFRDLWDKVRRLVEDERNFSN